MTAIRFSDNVTIRTDGALRVVRLRDGYYVIGAGCCIPCSDRVDAEDCLRMMLQPQRQSNR